MAYSSTTWATGDTITATKLNNLESGITGILNGTHDFTGTSSWSAAAGTAVIILNDSGQPADTFQMMVGQYNGGFTLFRTLNTTGWKLQLGTTDILVMDTAGRLGYCVTPEAWTYYKVMQYGESGALWADPDGTGAGSGFAMSTNMWYDGAVKRILADEATMYFQFDGTHLFRTAASSTAGSTITWTDVVKLTADRALMMGNGDNSDPAALANSAGIFAKDVTSSAELFGIDEAGNKPQLTPHNFSLFEPDLSYEYPWSYYCANDYLGVEIGVDMFGAIRALEALTGKQFIHMRNLPQKRDWHADQQARVAKREAEIAAAQEKNAKRKPEDAPVEVPKPYVPKAPPKWLADRLN